MSRPDPVKDKSVWMTYATELEAEVKRLRFKLSIREGTIKDLRRRIKRAEAQLELLKANRAVRGLGVVSGVTTLKKDKESEDE